jgi:metal-responsive CopG/Arc/MetJ family transcriptional regulator
MSRKVAISISEELLAEVDAESKATHLSRSRLLGMAATSYLQERRRKRAVEQYVRSYSEHPESEEELQATDAFLRDAWATDE